MASVLTILVPLADSANVAPDRDIVDCDDIAVAIAAVFDDPAIMIGGKSATSFIVDEVLPDTTVGEYVAVHVVNVVESKDGAVVVVVDSVESDVVVGITWKVVTALIFELSTVNVVDDIRALNPAGVTV